VKNVEPDLIKYALRLSQWWLYHHVVCQKFTSVSEVLAAIIIMVMEAASISEIWCHNPEHSHLQI
jgi:hypothetical protein